MKKLVTILMALTAVLSLGPTALASLTDGLVAYYPFNGNAYDESGSGNHGTVYGAMLTSDRFGNGSAAYYFDGTDDYVEVPNTGTLSPDEITISAWVNPTALTHTQHMILNKEDQYEFAVFGGPQENVTQIGELGYAFRAEPGGGWTWQGTNYVLPLDEFSHVVVFFDGNYVGKVYVNGSNIAETIYDRAITKSNSCLRIGARGCSSQFNYDPCFFFDGALDDIRIYNRVLSESEIQELYAIPIPGAVWLFGSGFVGLIAFMRRRERPQPWTT